MKTKILNNILVLYQAVYRLLIFSKGYRVICTQWEEDDTINFYCLGEEEYEFKQYHERTQIWNAENL